MKSKDWEDILRLLQVQKNIVLGVLDESDYGSSMYYMKKGFLNGIKTAEEYIISRLGKGEKII